MRKMFFPWFITILFLMGCSSSQKTFTEKEVLLKKLSIEKYGTTFNLLYNTEKSYSVVVSQGKASLQEPNPVLRFFVYDMTKEKIVLEDKVAGGKITWINNEQIEVSVTPGAISTELNNNNYGYLYNVKMNTKAEINSSSQNPNR